MRGMLWIAVLAISTPAFCQDCTTSVVVNVFDDSLKTDVQTLTSEDFRAQINGNSIAIVSSEQSYDSRLLVLLETDGANKDDRVHDIVETVTRMARQAPEGKPVAFGIYADRAVFTKDFISDPEKRTEQINEVIEEAPSLGKRVAMYDALLQGLHLFGEPQPGDTILLVASPYDDKSSHTITDVKRTFLATGTRLMAMLRNPISRVGRDFMWNTHEDEKNLFLDFTEQTGGAHSQFDPHFFGFAWRGYMLDLKVPKRGKKPHSWSLRIPELTGMLRHTKIFYPEQLPPCRVTASRETPK